ncbi:MBL fold metallo-hydrolase [Desulfurivibrio dismutans]|uniref:MBL fold metallo-hydrolase n=1 Tax=Desulfurivibrio dismutans TaxID=1398908 RepID=UPI0023DB6521|nr:MBL fold metallo-hydrolase [Desulfurivibrio alkaliphilus]MDF1614555.1 MBL fold metallo-hydrolase [Desulfurivibrio alkaliphilus]
MKVTQLTVGSMGVCCYILACEETSQALAIDPGGDEQLILDHCRQNNLQLKMLVCTHGHPDHVAANAVLKEATGAEIVMHQEDAAFFGQPEVEQYFSMLGLPPSPPPDRLVKDGDTIELGSIKLVVIHTPGHTPGGICLYSAPHLFSGDTLFVGAVGRTDFPGGDTATLIDSIRQRLLVLPPDTVVWPGHGYGGSKSTIAAEAAENPFLQEKWY